jgi:hypothetical protein
MESSRRGQGTVCELPRTLTMVSPRRWRLSRGGSSSRGCLLYLSHDGERRETEDSTRGGPDEEGRLTDVVRLILAVETQVEATGVTPGTLKHDALCLLGIFKDF